MMPNMDPRTLKNMMAKMGIKSTEIDSQRVVIETQEGEIIITNPQVTRIEAQGSVSFQISGDVAEVEKKVNLEVTEDDLKLVGEQTGVTDMDKIRAAIEESNGDIAEAILKLKG
jgi:nascent polypeptide-associated complex subunit alpha